MNGRTMRRQGDPAGRTARAIAQPHGWSAVGATEIALYLLLMFAVLFGGGALGANWRMLLICMTSAVLLPLALVSGGWAAFGKLSVLARLSVIAVPLLPLLQLIPLPPALWAALPGRELSTTIFGLVGAADDWHPLTLAPRETLMSLLFVIPPLAAFAAALTLDDRARRRCVTFFLGLIALSILVGLIQLGSRGAVLDFYGSGHRGNLLGFFANRNHEGVMIAVTAAFAIAIVHQQLQNRQAVLAWSVILSLTCIVAAVGTISRAALGLTIFSLATINLLFWAGGMSRKRLVLVVAIIAVAAAAIYLLTLNGVVERALSRFSRVKDDGRWEIWQLSAPLLKQYFPWGSGLGSFVPAYAAIEPLDSVSPSYLNHAHNDYLELAIEAGIPGLIVLGLFVAALAARTASLLTRRGRLGAFGHPAALAILLIALHSIVDYPLRTQAVIVPFGIFLAFFLLEPAVKKRIRVSTAPEGRE